MIAKRLHPATWFRDYPTANLIEVHSRGSNRQQLQKLASSDYIMNVDLRPEKGHSFVHLITTGAGEYYGPNNNADWFNKHAREYSFPEPKDPNVKTLMLDTGLEGYHSTFMKYGAVYREHNNSKKGGKAVGSVVAESVNPAMHRGELIVKIKDDSWRDDLQKLARNEPIYFSMGCFTAGAKVLMADMTYQDIDTIQPGALVISHTGKVVEVESVREIEKVNADIYTFKASGALSFECTEEHPHLILKKEQAKDQHGYLLEDIDIDGAEWVETKDIRPGDYMLTPIIPCGTTTVETPIARLYGYYLAEGCIKSDTRNDSKAVRFTCNKQDVLSRDICDIARDIGTIKEPIFNKHSASDQAWDLLIYDKDLAVSLEWAFGHGAHNKKIPKMVFDWDKESILTFLGAYHEGDGCFYTPKAGCSNALWSTCNRALALQIQQLLYSTGLNSSIGTSKHSTSFSGDTEAGYTVSYQVRADAEATAVLMPYSEKITEAPKVTKHCTSRKKQIGQYRLTRVQSIEVEERSTFVYNLHVADEDHSYIVHNLATHNCGVPYDMCSICSHKAPTRKDYCEHLKYAKLSLNKEGHQVFAINDKPHFHDISRVVVPADRIAFGLRKVASEMEVIEEEDISGLWLPISMIDKIGSRREADRAKILDKLANIEKKIIVKGMSPDEKHLSEAFNDNELSDDKVKELQGIPLDSLLSSLSEDNIMLPPKSFIRIVMKKPEEEIPGIQEMPEELKEVFSGLEGDEEVLSDGSYEPCGGHSSAAKNLTKDLAGTLSMEDEPVSRRIVVTSIKGGGDIGKEASLAGGSTHSAEAKLLAKEYAKYQLSFLTSAESNKYAHLAVIHNHAR